MYQVPSQGKDLHPIRTAASDFGKSGSTLIRLDPDALKMRDHSLRMKAFNPSGMQHVQVCVLELGDWTC